MQLGRSMNDLTRGIARAPGRVAVGLLALGLLVAGLPPVLGAQPYDTIDVRLTLEQGSLQAEIAYPRMAVQMRQTGEGWLPVAMPAFALWPWAGVDFTEAMSDLKAWDDSGQPLLIRATGPHEWEVAVGGGGFTIGYRIDSSKESFVGSPDTDLFTPTLTEDLAVLWARSWFMRPLDEALAELPVRVSVSGAYPRAASLGTADGRFHDTEALFGSLLVGGDVRTRMAGSGDGAIRFTLQGHRWRFSDDDFVEAILRIAVAQSEAMGFDPGSSMDVLLLEGSGVRSGGTAEGSVIVVYPDPELPLFARDPETLRLAAHEHFHRWNGEYAVSDPASDQGRYKWFQEGLTEYMAFRTLVSARVLEPADFVFKINQYIDNYHGNPMAVLATADVMARDYWTDPRLQRLAYDKGMLLGLILDARIRRLTDGEATIVDYLKNVISPDAPVAYDDDTLLGELAGLTGQSWEAFYEAFMRGSDPLPIGELCDDAGLDCRRDRGEGWRLQPTDRTARGVTRLMR
jgi:predicted metalloprotease with PDZ domain